jgi:hypothetical protein
MPVTQPSGQGHATTVREDGQDRVQRSDTLTQSEKLPQSCHQHDNSDAHVCYEHVKLHHIIKDT